MFEKIGNMFNGQQEKSSKEEYEEKEKELVEAKQEADNKPIKTSMEFKKGGDLDFSLEYIPDGAEDRYMQALDELKRLKEESQDEAIELDDHYNKLIAGAKTILEKIDEVDNEEAKIKLKERLDEQFEKIRKFETEELGM